MIEYGTNWQTAQKARTELNPFKQVNICGYWVWVRADPSSGPNDVFIGEGPLRDEYQLEPIVQEGHQLQWVLDIGAFIGTFTMKVKFLWPDARVISFEPSPESAHLYRLNTNNFGGISFYEAAAVRRGQEGTVHLSFDNNFHAARRIKEIVAQFGHTAIVGEPVRAVALLDVLEDHGNPDIAILKIDAEGAEADLLEDLGDAGYLERVVWIRGEWHYYESIPRIKAALHKTHVFQIAEQGHAWGAFIAHRKT